MYFDVLYSSRNKGVAYPGDGLQVAQWAGPPAGQRGPEAGARLAAEVLAWLRKNQGVDSGARLYGLYLLYRKDDHDQYSMVSVCIFVVYLFI